MQGLDKIRSANPELARIIEGVGGFLTVETLAEVAKVDRFIKVSVRCGNGRFTASADQAAHFIDIINEHAELKSKQTGKPHEGDYVRDVSLLQ